MDTTCPDTTFVVLPDVVTHLTSDVLVVKGDPDAVSFEYVLSQLAVGGGDDDDDGGSSSDNDDGEGTNNEAAGSQTGGGDSSGSTGSSSAGEGEESTESDWLVGDSSGVIHLHHLQVGFKFCIGFNV